MNDAAPSFQYAFEPLPRGRVGFHRWRWELWEGAALLACGWRTTPRDAERALGTATSRHAHEKLGVRALRPERAQPLERFRPGAVLRFDCGAVTCVLEPRRDPTASERTVAA